VPFGCVWWPLGPGGPTWQDEGRLAEAAQAVGGAARQHVGREEGGVGLQRAWEAAGGGGSRARSRDRRVRGPEEEDEDRFAKSHKCRDLTVIFK
jgi:hypothetical protein